MCVSYSFRDRKIFREDLSELEGGSSKQEKERERERAREREGEKKFLEGKTLSASRERKESDKQEVGYGGLTVNAGVSFLGFVRAERVLGWRLGGRKLARD